MANEIKDDVLGFEGVLSAALDYEEGKTQIIVKVNEAEARRLGVTNLQVAQELRASFEGVDAATIKKSDEDVDIIIRLDENSRSSEKSLDKIEIKNQQGRSVKLTQIASFEEQKGAYVIRRLNRKRTPPTTIIPRCLLALVDQMLWPKRIKKTTAIMPGTIISNCKAISGWLKNIFSRFPMCIEFYL